MKARDVIIQHGWKEFFHRWKKGIDEVTPMQQIKAQLLFTYITLFGIIFGLFICLLNLKQFWWLAIILFGAAGNTYVGLIGLKQRYNIFKNLEGGQDEQ